ncbi:hypothetical protein PpBr36_03490 [Pyricularia pennisetigena]|uniref:hypothetical protein n=1 Tax=Pyricularia pennisetigena TaxID=1578925 RepID=UPI0011525DA3|nr:hypothetical protein PpBr36_03490 [Pyricularia pennisetigena]TLS31010.1 hypothetical protein PpBr36_03490 [Pyricularia pennisetigena]
MAERRAPPRPPNVRLAPAPAEHQPPSPPIHLHVDLDSRSRSSYEDSSTNEEEDDDQPRWRRSSERQPVAAAGAVGRSSHRSSAAGPGSQNLAPGAGPETHSPNLSRLRSAIQNFTSQWFLVPQGAGITSVVLFQFEERFDGLDIVAYIFWALTIICLITFILLYALRVFMFPRHVGKLLVSNPGELACISSASIAFTSVNQMLSLVNPSGGPRWASVTAGLWWFNVSLAVGSTLFIPYAFARIQHSPSPGVAKLSPATQLPMIAAITLAAGGGVVSSGTGQPAHAQTPIIFVSYLSLAMALPLIMAFTAIYLVRLLDGSMPERNKVYQDMILAGPWGQASFAMQVLGRALVNNAPAIAAQIAGELVTENSIRMLGYSSMFIGFFSWGHATFWWAFAILSVLQSQIEAWGMRKRRWLLGHGEEKETYTLAVWALVFPWFRSSWSVDPSTGEYFANIPSPTGIAVDPALTAYGVDQAKELGRHLLHHVRPPIERVYSSPFYRCLQTIEPFVRSKLEEGNQEGQVTVGGKDNANDLKSAVDRVDAALNSSSSSLTTPASSSGSSSDAKALPLIKIRAEPGLGEWFGTAHFDHPAPAPVEELSTLFPGILDQGYSPALTPTSRGESIEQLHDRVALAVLEIIKRCDAEGVRSVVLCTHAAVVIALGRVLTGHMPADITVDDFHAYTCGLSVYRRRHQAAPVAVDQPSVSPAAGPVAWRDGTGVGGGWDCELNSDCSFLPGGCERGWKFSGDESFGGINQSNVDADKRTTRL